jgi:hypothetical protein
VGDAGAAALAASDTGLKSLAGLRLNGTQVGDAGAAALAASDTGLKSLKELGLLTTRVSITGVMAIRRAHPEWHLESPFVW